MTAERIGAEAYRLSGLNETAPLTYDLSGPIKLGRRDFAGHVYTMESANGWFSVARSGVVVKNCRCYSEPVIPEFE